MKNSFDFFCCCLLIHCQSNDSLEASANKHFYMDFMELGVDEKVSKGSPPNKAQVKGQTAAVSSFSNLLFSAARLLFFSPPLLAVPPSSSWCQRAVAMATLLILGL